MFSDQVIQFYKNISPPVKLPKGIEVLYPQEKKEVIEVVREFYNKYFNDDSQRTLIFGINPGRFGAGSTGINFTAAKQLEEYCGISHPFKKQSELSAEFIYEMIDCYGGIRSFYTDYFITSVSPLGYMRNGVNLNYYDDKKLQASVQSFIVNCIDEQVSWNVNKEKCICIGGEKNYKFLSALNKEHRWFKEIAPLPHPRFILQYRRKQKREFIQAYLDVLKR